MAAHIRARQIDAHNFRIHRAVRLRRPTFVDVNRASRRHIIGGPTLVANAAIADGIVRVHAGAPAAQFGRRRGQAVDCAPRTMESNPASQTRAAESEQSLFSLSGNVRSDSTHV